MPVRAWWALFGLATLSVSATAHAADRASCIATFEEAAELRGHRRLVDARQRLVECAGAACPADVQKECARELESIDASLPTVVLVARDQAGRDRVRGRVLVDGAVTELDGKAIRLDPGRHALRFEAPGCAPREHEALLAEAEKNRRIIGALECTVEDRALFLEPTPPTPSPSRVLPLTLVGAGVAGLVAFAYFGLSGRSELADIRATGCAPACDRDAVTAARTELLIGDILGVAGLVALGAAWLTFESAPAARGR